MIYHHVGLSLSVFFPFDSALSLFTSMFPLRFSSSFYFSSVFFYYYSKSSARRLSSEFHLPSTFFMLWQEELPAAVVFYSFRYDRFCYSFVFASQLHLCVFLKYNFAILVCKIIYFVWVTRLLVLLARLLTFLLIFAADKQFGNVSLCSSLFFP